ncbi:hypothetical protein [Streptomyces lavendofoliae]|uniref:hypothetical protein n=1 Tax=Streptomyces lavendofoliae TaxID=67314 RepID=UPI003D8D793B
MRDADRSEALNHFDQSPQNTDWIRQVRRLWQERVVETATRQAGYSSMMTDTATGETARLDDLQLALAWIYVTSCTTTPQGDRKPTRSDFRNVSAQQPRWWPESCFTRPDCFTKFVLYRRLEPSASPLMSSSSP